MRLGRESWLLIVVPAAVLVGAYVLTGPFRGEVVPPPPPGRGPDAEATLRVAEKAPVVPAAAAPATGTTVRDVDRATTPEATDDAAAWWRSVVLGPDGSPVAFAKVAVHRRSRLRFDGDLAPDPATEVVEYLLTDAQGRIAIRRVDGMTFDLVVSADGFGRRFLFGAEAPDAVRLPESRSYEGRVVDSEGRAVVGAKVLVHDGTRSPLEATTDADGNYRVTGASDRGALVEIRSDGFRQELRRVAEDGPTRVDVAMRAGAVSGGTATSEGASAADGAGATPPGAGDRTSGEEAVLYDRWTRTREQSVPVDADGAYSFSGLEPGRDYLVAAESDGLAGEVFVRGGDPAPPLKMLPVGDVVVVATTEDGGPAAGAAVTLLRKDGLPLDGPASTLATGGDGTATFRGLRPGVAVRAVVFAPGFGAAEARVTTPSGDSVEVRCTLRASAPFSGYVVGVNGVPLPLATVRVTRADDRAAPALFTATDAYGRFTVDAVAPGRVHLLVMAGNFASERSVKDLGPDGLVDQMIVLAPGAPFAPR